VGIKLVEYDKLQERWEPIFYLKQPSERIYDETRLLEEVCDILPDSRRVKFDQREEYLQYVDGSCIDKRTGMITECKEVTEEVSKRLRYRMAAGDMLIPLVEVGVMVPTIVSSPQDRFILVSDIFAVVTPKVDMLYLYWALTTEYVRDQFEARSKGAVIRRISLSDLKEITIPWLTEEERKEKIQMIKLQLSHLENEDKETILEKIDKIVSSHYNIKVPNDAIGAVVKLPYSELIENPLWTYAALNPQISEFQEKIRGCGNVSTLEEVCLTIDSGVNPTKEKNGEIEIGIVKSKNIAVLTLKDEFDNILVEQPRDKETLNVDDVLFRHKGTIGPAAIVERENQGLLFHDHLLRLKVDPEIIDPSYLVILLNSFVIREQVKQYVTSSTISFISKQNFGKLLIPIPTINEQKSLVDQIHQH
jgi:restriction endonuclease S subunit